MIICAYFVLFSKNYFNLLISLANWIYVRFLFPEKRTNRQTVGEPIGRQNGYDSTHRVYASDRKAAWPGRCHAGVVRSNDPASTRGKTRGSRYSPHRKSCATDRSKQIRPAARTAYVPSRNRCTSTAAPLAPAPGTKPSAQRGQRDGRAGTEHRQAYPARDAGDAHVGGN